MPLQPTVPENDQDNDGIADEVEGAWDAVFMVSPICVAPTATMT